MYFNPKKKTDSDLDNALPTIRIGTTEIKRVGHIKFLGVIIDDKLTWEHHIKALTKRLSSCTGSISRIMDSIPKHLYKDIYHTLFESYLTYGITVWGGSSESRLKPLFVAQKKVIRILFGDKEKYLEKFETCVRARPIGSQKLSNDFFIKEHTRSLFNKLDILNLKGELTI